MVGLPKQHYCDRLGSNGRCGTRSVNPSKSYDFTGPDLLSAVPGKQGNRLTLWRYTPEGPS